VKSTAEPENKEETLLSMKFKMIYHTSNYHELGENVTVKKMGECHLKCNREEDGTVSFKVY
jgi:hypothetical protein